MSFVLPASQKAHVQLQLRQGSRLVPIVLLALSVALFITYGLPSGFQQLALALGLIKDINEPVALEALQRQLNESDALAKLWKEIQDKNWGYRCARCPTNGMDAEAFRKAQGGLEFAAKGAGAD